MLAHFRRLGGIGILLLCFFRFMPLMLIIIMGCSFEKPFWARMLGSIPSTLNVLLAVEGDGNWFWSGVFAFSVGV